ncbi:MAG TPA: hypothetical protein VGK48_03860, partial [Terriglobia bacterium]
TATTVAGVSCTGADADGTPAAFVSDGREEHAEIRNPERTSGRQSWLKRSENIVLHLSFSLE